MSLCRSLQKLRRAEGIRLPLFQAFHNGAVGCQQQDVGLLRSMEVRDEHPLVVPGTSRHRTANQMESPTSPGTSWHRTDHDTELLVIKDVRHGHPSKPPRKAGPGTMAKTLVKTVMGLSDVKEDLYGALDEWAAFEVEFPLVATRIALERLRQQQQWHRIIQVVKWMFSKGIGKTHGAHSLLLNAYFMDGRLEEAGEHWDKLLASLSRSMPKSMFFFMASAYWKRKMPEKVVEVFEQMESFGIKPDQDLLRRAEKAYQQLNMPEKVELLGRKYALDSKTRRKERRLMARKALKTSKLEGVSQTDGDCNRECQTNDDKGKVGEHTIECQGKRTWASSSSIDFQIDEDEDSVEEHTTTVQGKETRASSSKDIQRDDDEDSVEEQTTTIQGKETRASSSKEQRVAELEGGCNTDFQTDDDEDGVEEQATTIQGKELRVSSSKEQRVTEPEGGCNMDFQTDDDEDSVKEQTTTIQGKKLRASSSKYGTPNRSKNFKRTERTDTASHTDDYFVEQVIATMSQSSFVSVKQSGQM